MPDQSFAASTSSAPAAPTLPVQNPLTLVMSIKSPQDYAQLDAMLRHIQALPPDQNKIAVALNEIGTVHFARFVFLDQTKLAVITTYDGPFDDYINDFVNKIGDIFDALLAHMDGAPPLPVREHREEFLAYVRENDIASLSPFYSAYPTLSVLDIQALAQKS